MTLKSFAKLLILVASMIACKQRVASLPENTANIANDGGDSRSSEIEQVRQSNASSPPTLDLVAKGTAAKKSTPTDASIVWNLDGNLNAACEAGSCPAITLTAQPSSLSPAFQLPGRLSQAMLLRVGSNKSENLAATFANGDYPLGSRGLAIMGFFWLDRYPSTQEQETILMVHDGVVPGTSRRATRMAVRVLPDGKLSWSLGKDSGWLTQATSTSPIGTSSWQHVGLVFDRAAKTATLVLNGSPQGTVVYETMNLNSFGKLPLLLGAAREGTGPASGKLAGGVDRVKIVSWNTTMPANALYMTEPGITFRAQVLADLEACGIITPAQIQSGLFNSPTLDSTSRLRAWVNAHYTQERMTLPKQTFNIGTSFEDFVYPIRGQITQSVPGGCPLNYSNDGARASPATPLYLSIRNAQTTGQCASAAMMLWGIYKSFGFTPRYNDWVKGHDIAFSDSHVMTEVFLPAFNQFVLQDPTFNLTGFDAENSKAYNIVGVRSSYDANPNHVVVSNLGYDYNRSPKTIWHQIPFATYMAYFGSPVTVRSAWQQ